METICQEIRTTLTAVFQKDQVNSLDDVPEIPLSLKDLEIGSVIAKGCNAIVHAARFRENIRVLAGRGPRTMSENSSDSGTESSIEVLSSEDDAQDADIPVSGVCVPGLHNTPPIERKSTIQEFCQPFQGYDLAVKMMFNYEAESNAPAILKAMYKEVVPAGRMISGSKMELWEKGCRKSLPPHPNIVDMQCLFADSVPHLPHAMALYPDALPKRLNRDGVGRNMTLFLVMKRYHCSLHDYLRLYKPPFRTALLLFAQLLEGIEHLVRQRVAHRDLKSDNILLDLTDGPEYPQLVITDFGCCLADDKLGLKLPFYTEETDKGGNSALMAPEIACARAGPYTIIDYNKADLWAAGTLAYEILGEPNPFYRKRPHLDSRNYNENELPGLQNVHPIFCNLIRSILRRSPLERPKVAVAANVCAMLLFGPTDWSDKEFRRPKEPELMYWLATCAAQILLEQGNFAENRADFSLKQAERELIGCFLHRVKFQELSEALDYFSAE